MARLSEDVQSFLKFGPQPDMYSAPKLELKWLPYPEDKPLPSASAQGAEMAAHIPQPASTPLPPIPGTPAWFRNELRDVEDLHDIKRILASLLISEATGIPIGVITEFLGYNFARRAQILTSVPSLISYNKEKQNFFFHHGRKLLDYMSSPESGIHHLDVEAATTQLIIQLLSSSNVYQGKGNF